MVVTASQESSGHFYCACALFLWLAFFTGILEEVLFQCESTHKIQLKTTDKTEPNTIIFSKTRLKKFRREF